MIFKKIYLTYRWIHNRYYTTLGQNRPGSNDNEGVAQHPPSELQKWSLTTAV